MTTLVRSGMITDLHIHSWNGKVFFYSDCALVQHRAFEILAICDLVSGRKLSATAQEIAPSGFRQTSWTSPLEDLASGVGGIG